MAGQNPAMIVKIEASLAALKEQLASGQFSIQETTNKLMSLANSYSGERTVQQAHDVMAAIDAVGGVTNLTAKEQASANRIIDEAIAKYQALGREAPAAMVQLQQATESTRVPTQSLADNLGKVAGVLGIAFGAGAAIAELKEMTLHAIEAGAAIEDQSKKLGVSAQAYQGWVAAAKLTGATSEDVSSAVSKMNANLDGGEDSTVGALKKAGLSFADVRNMKPEDAFNAIATGIMRIPDPMTQARVAVELFGKGAAAILPAIKDDIVKVGDAADKMSNETVHAMAEAQSALTRLEEHLTQKTATSLGEVALTLEELRKGGAGLGRVLSAIWESGGKQDAYIAAITKAREAIEGITAEEKDQVKFLLESGLTAEQVAATFTTLQVPAVLAYAKALDVAAQSSHLSAAEQRALDEQHKQAADALKKHLDALRELDTFSQDYRATLATMNAKTVEQVQGFLAAGASAATLQEAYKLTAGQMRAVTLAREADIQTSKNQEQANEALIRADEQAMQAAGKLWGEYHVLVAKQSGSSIDIQIADIHRWEVEQSTAFEASKNRAQMNATAVADFYSALTANVTAKLRALGVDQAALTDAATNHTQAGLQQIADAAQRTYQEMLKIPGVQASIIEKARQTAEAAQQAANVFGIGFASALDPVPAKLDKITESIKKVSDAMATWSVPNLTPAQQRANFEQSQQDDATNAARGFFKMPSLALNNQGADPREWIMNQSQRAAVVGASPSVGAGAMTGGGSTISVSIPITVQGSMLGSQQDLARIAGDAITQRFKDLGYGA